MTENEMETNFDTLKRVIEECPYDLDEEQGEETTETQNEGVIHR